jgi:hypothetical protein
MHTVRHERRPLPRRLASLWWWADTLAICILCLAAGIATLLAGQPSTVPMALFAITVVCGSYSIRVRRDFRRGWRQGYETATRVMIERSTGRTTDVQARAAVHGDPTPEPWDEHVPLRVPRRPS